MVAHPSQRRESLLGLDYDQHRQRLSRRRAGRPMLGPTVVMGVGAAMIMPGTLSTITAALPAAQRTRGVAIWSGFAAAGAIIGLLAAWLPAMVTQLPAAARDAVRQSPADGLAIASRLGPHGPALADSVRHAFITGLSAALIVVGAVLAVAAFGALLRAPRDLTARDREP
jgi:MFS family permease